MNTGFVIRCIRIMTSESAYWRAKGNTQHINHFRSKDTPKVMQELPEWTSALVESELVLPSEVVAWMLWSSRMNLCAQNPDEASYQHKRLRTKHCLTSSEWEYPANISVDIVVLEEILPNPDEIRYDSFWTRTADVQMPWKAPIKEMRSSMRVIYCLHERPEIAQNQVQCLRLSKTSRAPQTKLKKIYSDNIK